MLHVHGVARIGVAVVAVGTLALDLFSVDKNAVVLDLEAAEAHVLREILLSYLQSKAVKTRDLVTPQSGRCQREREALLRGLSLGLSLRHEGSLGVEKGPEHPLGRSEGQLRSQLCPRQILADGGAHVKIGKMDLFAVQKIYVTENTGKTDLVLILQINTVAPFQHQHADLVFALVKEGRHVKNGGGVAHLTVAHVFSVQIQIEAGIHTVEAQLHLALQGLLFHRKEAAVKAAGIFRGNVGRIHGHGEFAIAVEGTIVPSVQEHLPAKGDGDLIPIGAGIGLSHKILYLVKGGVKAKIPRAGKELKATALLPFRKGGRGTVVRNEIGCGLKAVLVQNIKG